MVERRAKIELFYKLTIQDVVLLIHNRFILVYNFIMGSRDKEVFDLNKLKKPSR